MSLSVIIHQSTLERETIPLSTCHLSQRHGQVNQLICFDKKKRQRKSAEEQRQEIAEIGMSRPRKTDKELLAMNLEEFSKQGRYKGASYCWNLSGYLYHGYLHLGDAQNSNA